MLVKLYTGVSWVSLGVSCLGFSALHYWGHPGELGTVALFLLACLLYAFLSQCLKPKVSPEIIALKTQLKQMEQLATIGYLAAGINHELKNPLNFILNFSELSLELITDIKENPNQEELINELKMNIQTTLNHARRAESIMKNILLYSKENKQPEKQKTDLNQLLEECFQLAFHAEKSYHKKFNVKVVKTFDDKASEIPLYKEELGRAFINLINNALYALHERQQKDPTFVPSIELSTEYNEQEVKIHIRDNGPGIPKESLDKIFQDFYSTKPAENGTGLGLSITKDIVKQHKGSISVSSEKDKFTDFLLTIPILEG